VHLQPRGVLPLLAGSPQGVQPPAPLQVLAPAHSLAGSVPGGMFAQLPSEPVTLQARQRPVHVLLQQTPSTQRPLWHSPLIVQLCPMKNRPQPPAPLQTVLLGHPFAGSCA